MDWIEGTDLEALLGAEGRPGLDPALAIGYLEQAAEALAHLHAHDPPVVHGDVKPANLILTSSGRIVLVDFGLSSTPTDELRRAGTAGYVAPEVAAGGETDRGVGRLLVRRHRARAAHRRASLRRRAELGAIERERIPALERIVRRTWPPTRRVAMHRRRRLRREAAAMVGRRAPDGNGHARAGRRDTMAAQSAEDSVDEVAARTGGHCVSPADDGPLRRRSRRPRTASTPPASSRPPRGAGGRGHGRGGAPRRELPGRRSRRPPAPGAGRPAAGPDRRRDRRDDRRPASAGDRPCRGADCSPRAPAWALVAPGLSIPPRAGDCPYRGLMAFRSEDGDLFFGREEVVASDPRPAPRRRLHGRGGRVGEREVLARPRGPRPGVPPGARRAGRGDDAGLGSGRGARALARRRPASLLIVDQLEEVFTLCPDEAGRAASSTP